MPATGYPPPDHILRDLGIRCHVLSPASARARLPASPHVTGADGGVRAGVLAVLVDVVAGAAAVRTLSPDWMATADLSLQLGEPATGPWVEARAEVVRRGRTTLVVEAALWDVAGPDGDGASETVATDGPAGAPGEDGSRLVGTASVTMAVLPARPGDEGAAAEDSFPVSWAFGDAVPGRPVTDAIGARVVDRTRGRLSMPTGPYVHNSFGAAQGGVMALLAELSALSAVEAQAGWSEHPRAAAATGLQVAYLALGRPGPITSSAHVLRARDGCGSAVVELTDEGAGNRLTTVVNVVVGPGGSAGHPAGGAANGPPG